MTTTTPVPNPEAGEVYWVDLDPAVGTEQAGRRPVMVLSDSQFHAVSLRCLVCPITSNRSPWPTKIILPEGCVVEGAILLDQMRMIDRKARHMRYIGKLPDEVVDLTAEALSAFLGRTTIKP